MGIFQGFQIKQLEKYIFKRNAAKIKAKISPCPDNIKTVGFLVDGRQKNYVQCIEEHSKELFEQGKEVSILVYVPKLAKDETFDFPTFTKEDFTWYGYPNNSKIIQFIDQTFDLLINSSLDKLLPLESICALSAANYIIGNGTNHLNKYYDFILKLNNSDLPDSFIENLHHYLNLQR